MSAVFQMPAGDGRAVAQALSVIIREALAGKVDGVAITIHSSTGQESVVFSGFYGRNPQSGVKAALLQSWELTKALAPPLAAPKRKPRR